MINIGDIFFTRRCPFCDSVISITDSECKSCRDMIPKPNVRKVNGSLCACAFPYKSKYRRAVLNYKFHGKRYLAQTLALYLYKTVRHNFPDEKFDFVTYVPVYKDRRFKFNHSKRLAYYLSKYLSVPCAELLVKTVKTEKQHSLSLKLRRNNVKNTFAATCDLSGKNILIVDDIITSGYTLSECIKTLLLYNPEKLSAVTLCNASQGHISQNPH